MKMTKTLKPRSSKLGAPILEYVIIAVGIGIGNALGPAVIGGGFAHGRMGNALNPVARGP